MSDTLRLGIICFPSLGGSGVVAAELAAGLAERGHEVHLIATAPPGRPLAQRDNLTFHAVRVSDEPLFDDPPYAIGVAAAIIEIAREHRLGVINGHYAVPHSIAAYLARQALSAGAPRFVTTLHGTDVTRRSMAPGYAELLRLAVLAADGLTAPSHFLRDRAAQLFGTPASAIEVIPNFVDTHHFAPAEHPDRHILAQLFTASAADGPVLFHVSNFRAVKRPTELVEVLALLRHRLPARLLLVGDGPQREQTMLRARQLGLERYTCFLGARADFAALLRHADAFVLTSESESFGLAALEAMSSGVPVFAYRAGGLPEVVAADSGVLVAQGDRQALADAILATLTDAPRLAKLQTAARRRAVEHFQPAPAVQRYEEYFRRILRASGNADERAT